MCVAKGVCGGGVVVKLMGLLEAPPLGFEAGGFATTLQERLLERVFIMYLLRPKLISRPNAFGRTQTHT
eukprot:scaffold1709_cov167-Alexandrium_tamarense.AAC.1